MSHQPCCFEPWSHYWLAPDCSFTTLLQSSSANCNSISIRLAALSQRQDEYAKVQQELLELREKEKSHFMEVHALKDKLRLTENELDRAKKAIVADQEKHKANLEVASKMNADISAAKLRAEDQLLKTREELSSAIARAEVAEKKFEDVREAVLKEWMESEDCDQYNATVAKQSLEIAEEEALKRLQKVLQEMAPDMSWLEVNNRYNKLYEAEAAAVRAQVEAELAAEDSEDEGDTDDSTASSPDDEGGHEGDQADDGSRASAERRTKAKNDAAPLEPQSPPSI